MNCGNRRNVVLENKMATEEKKTKTHTGQITAIT